MSDYTEKNDTALAILNAFFLGDPNGTLSAKELRAIVERELPNQRESEPVIKHMHNLLDVFQNVKVEGSGEDKVWHGLIAKPVEVYEQEVDDGE